MTARPIRITIVGDDQTSSAFRGAEDNAESFGGTIEKVSGIGAKALGALGIGAGAVALAMEGLTRSLDIGASNDKLAAQLGLTTQTAETAGKAASNLYKGAWGDSMEDVNTAIGAVGSTLLDMNSTSQGELESTTAKAMDLASAFDMDVNEAVNSAGILMKTGLARDANEAFDLVTAALQGVPAAVRQDVLDATDEYSTYFKALGLSGAQSFGILKEASKGGAIQIDKTGDALKELTIRATDMSTTSVAAYQKLGLNADEMATKFAKGGASSGEALQQVAAEILKIQDPVEQSNTAIAIFGTQMEDIGRENMPGFLRGLAGTTEGMENVDGAAQRMGDTLNDNAKTKIESFKRTITTGLTDVIGNEVLPAFEDLSAKIGPAFDKVKDAIGQFASGDAAGAGVSIGKLFGFEEDSSQTAVIIDALQIVMDKFGGVRDWIKEIMPEVKEAVGNVVDAIKLYWDIFGEDILTSLQNTWDTIIGVIGGAMEIGRGIIETVLAVINGDWGAAWEGIKTILSGAWQIITSIIGGALGVVTGILSVAWTAIQAVVVGAWDAITGKIGEAWNGIKSRIADGVIAAIHKFQEFKAKGEFYFEMLKHVIGEKIDQAVDVVKGLPRRVLDTLSGLGSTLYNSGRDLIQGLIDGATSLLSSLGKVFLNIIPGWIREPFKQALGIQSPSKVFKGYGENIGQGLIDGLNAMQAPVELATTSLAPGRVDTAYSGTYSAMALAAPTNGGSTRPVEIRNTFNISGSDPRAVAREIKDILDGQIADALEEHDKESLRLLAMGAR